MNAPSDQPAGRVRRAPVRLIFLSVLALFIWNAWRTADTGIEPYPTLLMPSFRSSPQKHDGAIHVVRPEIVIQFKHGSTERVDPNLLLPEIPSPALRGIMRMQFLDVPRRLPAPKDPWGKDGVTRWLRRHVVPGYVLGRLRRETWDGVPKDAAAWLWRRASAARIGREIESIAVEWSIDIYTGSEPDWRVERKPLSRLEVAP